MVEHVPGLLHGLVAQVLVGRAPLGIVLRVNADLLQRLGFGGIHPKDRRGDTLPERKHLLEAGQGRIDDLVRRVAAQLDLALGPFLAPMEREELGAVAREPGVVLLQAIRQGRETVIRAQARRRAQFVQPAQQARGRLVRLGARHAETFQVHEPRNALRPGAGVHRSHVAAEAVPDEVDRRPWMDLFEQLVQVAYVIGEPVGVRLDPVGQAVAAPIRRIDVPVAVELVDQELERSRNIHPAVQEHHPAIGATRPVPHVVSEAADVEVQGFALAHGGRDDISPALPAPR